MFLDLAPFFFSLAFVCSFSLTAYLFNFNDINDDQVLCQSRLVDVFKMEFIIVIDHVIIYLFPRDTLNVIYF